MQLFKINLTCANPQTICCDGEEDGQGLRKDRQWKWQLGGDRSNPTKADCIDLGKESNKKKGNKTYLGWWRARCEKKKLLVRLEVIGMSRATLGTVGDELVVELHTGDPGRA